MPTKPKSKKKPEGLSIQKLIERADELLIHDELTIDQQHQLMAVKQYLSLEDRPDSSVGQSALRCAEMLIDAVKLDVFQRRYGVQNN